jgi:hypothetical protein
MRRRTFRRSAAIAAFALCATNARSDAEGELRFDPFRPREEVAAAPGAVVGRQPETFLPELRATLITRERSVVDLGGVILAVGEDAHGYTLLEVWPYQALFDYGGEEVVLEVAQPLRAAPPAAREKP